MYRSGSSNYNSRARYGKGSYNTSSYGKSNILNANNIVKCIICHIIFAVPKFSTFNSCKNIIPIKI